MVEQTSNQATLDESMIYRDPGTPFDVCWTFHAIDRANERFNGSAINDLPGRRIIKIGKLVAIGEEFHVQTMTTIYVCKRITETRFLIKTVMFS